MLILKDSAVDGRLIIRVAKDAGDFLGPLNQEELAGLAVYIKAFKFGGPLIDLDSLPPDQIRYQIDVEIDQSIINLEGGNIDGSAQSPVLDAIKAYHRNIGESGIIYLSKVVDSVQQVPGIIDVQINAADFFEEGVWNPIDRKWEGPATYSTVDQAETNVNYFSCI